VAIAFLLPFIGNAQNDPVPPIGDAFVDSVVAWPYDKLVADLPASKSAISRALVVTREREAHAATGKLLTDLCTVYFLLGRYDSSTYHGLRAVELLQAHGLRTLQGEALTRLAYQLRSTDLEEAFRYFREGIALLEAERAELNLCGAYDNFGVLQEDNGDLDSALFYYRRALAMKESLNDSIGIPYSLNKIGTAMLTERRFEEALALFQRSDTIRKLIDDRLGLADQPVYFGDLYQAWGRPAEAIPYFEAGVERGKALDYSFLVRYCYERLAECHEAIGDHRAALVAMRAGIAIKDSVRSEQTTRTILELKEQFNAAEKDREIAMLAERAEKRRLYTLLVAIAVGLVVVSILLFQQMRRRKERAERDAMVIKEREAGLKAMFEATENERGRLARELHDGIGQQLGGLKHRLESLKDRTPEGVPPTLVDAIGIVDDTSREVRDLAHQMMPKALERLGLVPALEELLRRAFEGTPVRYALEHHRVPEDLPVELATGLYRIVQELINNTIKHAQAERVDVQLLRNKSTLVLLVEDDGVGVRTDMKRNGIGLMNISDRARSLGGTFALENAGDKGTVATVRIPLQP
jgi:signal transduction histidine kinase